MSRPTYVNIDLAALKHNFERVQTFAPKRSIIAMIKANAYGHGLVRIAQALHKADALGVASVDEGVKLREAGVTQPIILMEGLFYLDELLEAAKYDFSLVVHHKPQVEILEKTTLEKSFTTWLKINTGMHRLGIDPNDTNEIYQRLHALPNVNKPIGLMTHFARADELNSSATMEQLEIFNKAAGHLNGPRSFANSVAILAWPAAHGDWIRPGLTLFGASPFLDKTGLDFGLQPVMTLRSRLISIVKVKKGGVVGYGGTWTAPEDLHIGVVGVGYGDGYPEYAKNGTPVLVNGVECPLAGQVSMDMLTVDLRNLPNANIGDPVVLWGAGLPAERVAKHCETSAYEILTRMTPRPKIEVRE